MILSTRVLFIVEHGRQSGCARFDEALDVLARATTVSDMIENNTILCEGSYEVKSRIWQHNSPLHIKLQKLSIRREHFILKVLLEFENADEKLIFHLLLTKPTV